MVVVDVALGGRQNLEVLGTAGVLALPGRPVVGGEQHQRVVPLAQLLERGSQPPEVLVDVVHHGGEHLHVAGEHLFLGGGQLVPGRDVVAFLGIAGRQRCISVEDAQLDLAVEAALADLVPAGVVGPPVLLDVGLLGLEWSVDRPVRQVQEERLVGPGRLLLAHHPDGLVGDVVGEVVVVGVLVGANHAVVADQPVGVVEVGEPVEETVVVVEAPLERPRVPGAHQVGVFAQVPLAHHEGGVAPRPQYLSHRGAVLGELGGVAGIAGVGVAHVAHPHVVVVEPGEQRRPGGRAHGIDVEVQVAQPFGRHLVDVGGVDLRAVAPQVGEAQIVQQHHHDVGRPFWCPHRLGPPRV